MTRDLGTYFVRVEFEDGRGFFMEYKTGGRWIPPHSWRDGCSTLDSCWHAPTWESEDDLASTIEYMFTDGNYSCDCNLTLFLARASGEEDPEDQENGCGHTLKIKSLDLYGPDGLARRRIIG